ncbi:MAG: hypothetical protein ACREHV_08735 [Rhizomicrobium sp.]
MSEHSGKGTNQKPTDENNGADEEPHFPHFYEDTGHRASQHKKKPDPPNWVEKGGFFIVLITLCAAIWAAIEADRLANLTQYALRDGRLAAQTTHLDSVRNENLTADALGQAEVNSTIAHSDNAAALKAARDANASSGKVAIQQAQAAESQAHTAKQQATALERMSMSGRPYVFVNNFSKFGSCLTRPDGNILAPGKDFMDGGDRVEMCAYFSLTNYGDTPAIINSIKSQIYVVDGKGRPKIKADLVRSAEFGFPSTTYVPGEDRRSQVAGGSTITIAGRSTSDKAEQHFIFYNLPSGETGRINRQLWFWTVIRYVDIYGCNHQSTALYPLTGGPGEDAHYNQWDTDKCIKGSTTQAPMPEPSIPE